MKKLLFITVCCLTITSSFGQSKRFVSVYLETQLNTTLHDIVKQNNPWGIGLGLQAFFNTGDKLKLTFDITKDEYLADDKVLSVRNGSGIPRVNEMNNILAGISYHPIPAVYFSFVSGASFINNQTLLAIKPSLGIYFSENRRWMGKLSYINVYDRDKVTKQDFGSVSFSLGMRLF